jgi:hypothetical protein
MSASAVRAGRRWGGCEGVRTIVYTEVFRLVFLSDPQFSPPDRSHRPPPPPTRVSGEELYVSVAQGLGPHAPVRGCPRFFLDCD